MKTTSDGFVPLFSTTSAATPIWQLLAAQNPVFRIFATHACLLVIKVQLLGFHTEMLRLKKKVFINPEDLPAGRDIIANDEDVERVRRAHRNDLENVLPYLITGFLFVLTDPIEVVAVNCFRIVSITRAIHTIFYALYPMRQSVRTICFFTTLVITIFMAIDCIALYLCF